MSPFLPPNSSEVHCQVTKIRLDISAGRENQVSRSDQPTTQILANQPLTTGPAIPSPSNGITQPLQLMAAHPGSSNTCQHTGHHTNLVSRLLRNPIEKGGNQETECLKTRLWDCSIGEEGCAALISALISNPSHLTELNLSYNTPGDSGVKLLSALLEDPHCKLKKLW
uniref:Uncharacterized protein n=1 Tax=Cyprinus carpio TaxID=7962 RepID=A0A8C1MPL9_CYPCA